MLSVSYKTRKTEYKVHYHNHHEILLITEGRCEMLVNGVPYIAEKGDAVLICNLENHSTKVLEEPYSRYVLTIDPALFQTKISDMRLVAMFKHRGKNFSHCISARDTDAEYFFRRLFEEKQRRDSFSDEICLSLLKSLLIDIFRANSENFETTLDKTAETVLNIEGYIDSHFKEDLRMEEVARLFYLNKYYFSHCFKEVTGLSPKQYLTTVRLNHSINLLNGKELSVSEICAECGFSDINNFIRLFKLRFGKTPGEYRKSGF